MTSDPENIRIRQKNIRHGPLSLTSNASSDSFVSSAFQDPPPSLFSPFPTLLMHCLRKQVKYQSRVKVNGLNYTANLNVKKESCS